MPTRVPSNGGLDWGLFPSASELPNAAGSSTQVEDLPLGARAWVPGVGGYSCTVPTAGGASWTLTDPDGGTTVWPVVDVYAEADFPDASGGMITLASSTVYRVLASITLTTGNRIVCPAGTTILGVTAAKSKIIGDVNGSLISQSGTTGTSRFDALTIQNNNAGTSSAALETSASGGTIILINVLATAGQSAIKNTASTSLTSFLSTFTATNASASVIDVQTGGSFYFTASNTAATGANTNHFRLRVGATISTLTIGTSFGWLTYGANGIGILNDGATISTRVKLQNIVTQGTQTGTFTPNSGWSQATVGWHVNDTTGLPDSSAIGASNATSPFLVPISGAGTWTTLTPAVGTPWVLDSDSERFDMVSDTTGQLRMLANKPRRVLVTGAANLDKTGGTVSASLAVFIDGVIHTPSISTFDVTNRTASQQVIASIHLTAANMTFDLRLRNNDNADDITVESAGLSVAASVIT